MPVKTDEKPVTLICLQPAFAGKQATRILSNPSVIDTSVFEGTLKNDIGKRNANLKRVKLNYLNFSVPGQENMVNTVTFFYNFCLHEPFSLKFQILVVKICNDLTLISKSPNWPNWTKFKKIQLFIANEV